MSGIRNNVFWGTNVDFTGNNPPSSGVITDDGQILIGSVVFPNIRAGKITSLDTSINWTFGQGTIDGSVNVASIPQIPTQFVTDNGTATPALNILNVNGVGTIHTSGTGNNLTIEDKPATTFRNIGMTVSSGLLTIHGDDGLALSASNPGIVVMPSNVNHGQSVVYKITQNYTLQDTSLGTDLDGATWGTTAAVEWSSAQMPLFPYFVSKSDDTAIIPMIARKFYNGTRANTVTVKGTSNPANAADFISLDSTITNTDYQGTQTLRFGWFLVTKDASDNWTFIDLDFNQGVGVFPTKRAFGFPQGQNGAQPNSWYSSDNGIETMPTFFQAGYSYYLHEDGTCTLSHAFDNIAIGGSAFGDGRLRIHTPLPITGGGNSQSLGTLEARISTDPASFPRILTMTCSLQTDPIVGDVYILQPVYNDMHGRRMNVDEMMRGVNDLSMHYRARMLEA